MRARQIAEAALSGHVMKGVGNATHYHASYVAPYWSPSLMKVATVGAHIFYRWMGGWGLPGAFGGAYSGDESVGFRVAALNRLSGPGEVQMVAMTEVVDPLGATQVGGDDAGQGEGDRDVQVVEVATIDHELVAEPQAVVSQAEGLVPAEDLDWTGRVKPRGPSRLAMPTTSF